MTSLFEGIMNHRKLEERFWAKVKICQPDECWEWQAVRDPDGYGRIEIYNSKTKKARPVQAHRIAWQLLNGDIPNKLHVLHSCDNPSCVNPNHLFLGTNLDNARDRVSKGRGSCARGEKQGNSKLTTSQVLEMRRLHTAGQFTHQKLANMFNIERSTVTDIVNRKRWTHI